jgi:hypothetical protein
VPPYTMATPSLPLNSNQQKRKEKKTEREKKKIISENCRVLHVIKEKKEKKLNMVVSILGHRGPDSN